MISHVERAVALSMAAAIASLTAPARADITRAQCIAANGQAQSLRRDGKLGEARDLLRSCSDPKCPNTVATDCTRRLDELESAQPTIVFDVKDGSGADLQAVKVTVDDRPLADKIDGTPFQADPGDHAFTFEVDGQAPVTQHFVLTEGQKGRHESIVIGPPPAQAVVAAPSPEAPAPETVEPPPSGLGTQKKSPSASARPVSRGSRPERSSASSRAPAGARSSGTAPAPPTARTTIRRSPITTR